MSDNLLDLGKRPILPVGDYGADGNAVLDRYAYIDSRMAEGAKADQFQVAIKTTNPDDGLPMVVRVFADPPRRQGTVAPKWFRNLGVPDEVLADTTMDEEERATAIKSIIEGQKVIVTLGIRQAKDKDTGEQLQFQSIKNIVLLG